MVKIYNCVNLDPYLRKPIIFHCDDEYFSCEDNYIASKGWLELEIYDVCCLCKRQLEKEGWDVLTEV